MAERENDSVDLLTAFAIGAMIGVGATLLLRSDPPTAGERFMEGVRPIARKARRAATRAGKRYSKGLGLTREATRDLGGASKEVLEDLQKQVEDILDSARSELGRSARQQLRTARKAIRKYR